MNFDLNIDNYSKDELIEMFELPPQYDNNILNMQETKMKEKLTLAINNGMSQDMINKTLQFIIKAKNILLVNTGYLHQDEKSKSELDIVEHAYNNSYAVKDSKLTISDDHMIQERDKIPYLSSYPSQYFPGVINPLKKRVRHMNLNIDSKFRDNYYTTSPCNFTTSMHQNLNNVVKMELSAIEIPNTFFVISKQFDNNYFFIELPDINACQLIEIPEGNYDYTGLETALNNELSILGAPYSNIVFQINITNNTNGTGQMLVGLDTSTNPTFNFELDFQKDRSGLNNYTLPLTLKLGWVMGFRNGKYINNQNYISEGIVDLTGSRYLYLVIDDYNTSVNNSFYSIFNESLLNKNILARISLSGGSFTVVSQNNLNITTTPREYFGPVNLQNINVQLLDTYGRIVDLNSMDFSLCLNLTIIYDI